MNVTKPTMTEDASRFYTTLFSVFTILGLIAGGLYSLVEYFDARAKEVEVRKNELDAKVRENQTYQLQVATAQLEAKKPFYVKHLDLCIEASGAAAVIAESKDPKKKQEALDNFWRLWDGPLAVVEGHDVAHAMVEFGDCLKNSHCDRLDVLSLDISHSCRDEISDHFDLHLPPLPSKDTGGASQN